MRGKKPKILYLLASPTWGGGEQYVGELMRAMESEGWECHAVVPCGGDAVADKLAGIVPRERIYTLRMGSMFDRRSAREIGNIVLRNDVGLIHANKFSDAFIAVKARKLSRRSGVKVVMTRHLVRRGKTGRLYNRLYAELDALVFVSDIARREFMARGPIIDTAKVSVIHTGIAYAPQQDYSSKAEPPVIAFAGRIVREKGLDVFFDALGYIAGNDFRVKIIGRGEEEYISGLRQKAEAAGFSDKVDFVGFTDDVNGELQEASVGVLPSVVPEGFGLAAVEYMRASLAVVTTDNGAQKEFLDDGREGMIIPPGDAGRLAAAVKKLLDDPALRRGLGLAARRRYEAELSMERYIALMTALYEGVLSK